MAPSSRGSHLPDIRANAQGDLPLAARICRKHEGGFRENVDYSDATPRPGAFAIVPQCSSRKASPQPTPVRPKQVTSHCASDGLRTAMASSGLNATIWFASSLSFQSQRNDGPKIV